MADAKRRGWTGRRSKSVKRKKHKEQDFDVASSAAWTDVTTFTGRESALGRQVVPEFDGDEPRKRRGLKNGNKCVVM